MKEILLDSSAWKSPDDFYRALLPKLGAPAWHGRNLDALDDSLFGGINEVDPPFSVTVRRSMDLSTEMSAFLAQVAIVFANARKNSGADISFEVI